MGLDIQDSYHLLQKMGAGCDTCHHGEGAIFLIGGGIRECISCHLKSGCKSLTIRNPKFLGERMEDKKCVSCGEIMPKEDYAADCPRCRND